MKTYQDMIEVGDHDKDRMEFVRALISEHRSSELYRTAEIGHDYARLQNRTITQFQKLLYTVSGKAIPDNYSSNYKLASGFFKRFVTQEVQYLLGNGVTWSESGVEDRLGESFDAKLQELAKDALTGGVAFGFMNYDHLEPFSVREFAPLYDEENGALMAGARFWQVSPDKPLRATLYEIDGYTDYLWQGKYAPSDAWTRVDDRMYMMPKKPYMQVVRSSEAEGTQIYDGMNYETLPIVPLYGNKDRQSEIVGIREQIDCYDLIKSGFANTVDEASFIYWTIQNNGGMDDVDLAQFVERIKTVHAANLPADAAASAHTQDAPYESREALLERLRSDLYDDYMALDTKEIAGGAVTATQIKAAYEPLNAKVDDFEMCVHDFLDGILAVLGLEGEATFTRSKIVNTQEEVQTLVASGVYLDAEYVTRKILTLLGDADAADEMLKRLDSEAMARFAEATPEEGEVNGRGA